MRNELIEDDLPESDDGEARRVPTRHAAFGTRHSSLTDQQARAVTTRGVSVVLSSGAGCGKTQVLTQRYLSHLRDDAAEIGQLVAITFTDRAAREMRKRIRDTIKQGLKAAANPAARERWAAHLRGLETAAVCTIHAFCGTLLRQHSLAAGLDPRFEVLEEVLSVNLRDEALRDGLQSLLTAPSLAGDDLRELVPLYGWRATVEAVEHLLVAPDPAAWDEWCQRPAAEIAGEWLSVRRAELLPAYVRHLTTAAPKIAHCLRLLRTTPCLGPKTRVNVQRLLAETPRLAEAPDLAAAVAELCEAAKVGPERGKAWPDDQAYQAIKEAFEGFRKDLPDKLELFTTDPDRPDEAVTVGQRLLRVAAACARVYRERKRAAGVVDFHDLLTLARDLLRDRPDVREQVRRRFRFVLIDELQDTDPVQMELVEYLFGNGLTHGKLFAVGDAKQSIYRFRGAEVTLFQGLRQSVPPEGRQELSVNFRSQPALLHFTNALLGRHMPDYEPLTARRPQTNPVPCIEFLWCPRGDKESVTESRRREADRIAGRVAAMVGRGERLVVDRTGPEPALRPVRPGDIVLLFRSMSNVAIYEAALRTHGLDYYLVGGRAFFAKQEVYDLLNLLRALENPQDAVSLAGTIRSPFGCLSDEVLYLLARHRDGLWAGLHDDATLARLPAADRPAAARARRYFDRWRERKDRLPIAGLLNFVLTDCGYDAALQYEFLGDRKLANLWKLIDLARTFDRSGLFGLAEFIQRLGELVRSQPREEQAATQPENADVVRLMTIHQAKGLEFPVVVLPDLAATTGGPHLPAAHWDARLGCVARPPADDDPPLFSDFGWQLWRAREALADWHEDLRTLYVACTRAEDYLVLSAALPEPVRPVNTAITVLAERFDLVSGRCLDPSLPDGERPLIRVHTPDEPVKEVSLPRRPVAPPAPLTGADEAASAPVPKRRPAGAVVSLEVSELSALGPRERVLRMVMKAWDFRDQDGWQQPLADALAAETSLVRSARLVQELAPELRAFAESELRGELDRAAEVWRDIEFLFAWPFEDEPGPTLQGCIDVLWRDERGGWHVLAWDASVPTVPDPWQGRKLALLVRAWAVALQVGTWPRSMTLFGLTRGQAVTASPREPMARAALRLWLHARTCDGVT
jgi:ATP-dependent helicase/nuclease subunit A